MAAYTPDTPLATIVRIAEAYSRNGAPILAIVVHMAEGGGTDTWLTRDDGNSSHYVIKYDGRIAQLVPESSAAGSMNPRLTRKGDDAPYVYGGRTITYGRSALDAVLGSYSPIYVNRAVIAIEVEGFAKDGPNAAQVTALTRLIADIKARRGPLGMLGHRDQQDYKPCPGHRVPWHLWGGHGAAQEDSVFIPVGSYGPFEVRLTAGDQIYDEAFKPLRKAGDGTATGFFVTGTGYIAIAIADGAGGKRLGFVKAAEVNYNRPELPPAPPPPDCTAEVAAATAAAVSADRERIVRLIQEG